MPYAIASKKWQDEHNKKEAEREKKILIKQEKAEERKRKAQCKNEVKKGTKKKKNTKGSSTEHSKLVCLVLQQIGEFVNYFNYCGVGKMADAHDAADDYNLSFLNDQQLLELLENSDIEGLDIDEDEVPQLQLVVVNQLTEESQRCPSPPNSNVPLEVRLGDEKKRQQWRTRPRTMPIIAPLTELPVEDLLGPSEYFPSRGAV
ncbi:hypothetical protein J6590_057844 [Homalodisca vitripennis]|nr:hypothetical protein J6590_057844 [Homalodisca vitripennis]